MFWRAEQELAKDPPAASQRGLRQKLRGAARQESRAAVSSHPAVLDTEAATSICQIPGVYCTFPALNSACPTPELVFSFLDSVICLPLLQEICFIIIIALSSSAYFLFFVPSSFKHIGVISYLYDSAQRCKWKAKPCCTGHFSVVRNRPHPYDITG